MTFLVSPTDRELLSGLKLKASAISSALPESYGADVLSVVEGRGKLAVQRKQFPDDFIASIEDGRIAKEVALLQYSEYPVIVAEGWPDFTADGHMVQEYASRWTKQQLRNLLRSAWRVHGIQFERTDDLQDTVDAILEMDAHFREAIHRSLLTRTKRSARDTWGTSSNRDFARFLLQGFPGVGSVLAEQIFDHFGHVPLRWECDITDLKSVLGIGDKRAKVLWDVLE